MLDVGPHSFEVPPCQHWQSSPVDSWSSQLSIEVLLEGFWPLAASKTMEVVVSQFSPNSGKHGDWCVSLSISHNILVGLTQHRMLHIPVTVLWGTPLRTPKMAAKCPICQILDFPGPAQLCSNQQLSLLPIKCPKTGCTSYSNCVSSILWINCVCANHLDYCEEIKMPGLYVPHF